MQSTMRPASAFVTFRSHPTSCSSAPQAPIKHELTVGIHSTQRVALVTGGNRGIGFETAKQLARRGFNVVIAARDEGSGKKAVQAIQADGGKATFLLLDVSCSESIRN